MKQVKSNLSALGMCTDIFFDGSDNGSPPITELVSSVAKIRLGVRLIVFCPPIAECTERWVFWLYFILLEVPLGENTGLESRPLFPLNALLISWWFFEQTRANSKSISVRDCYFTTYPCYKTDYPIYASEVPVAKPASATSFWSLLDFRWVVLPGSP